MIGLFGCTSPPKEMTKLEEEIKNAMQRAPMIPIYDVFNDVREYREDSTLTAKAAAEVAKKYIEKAYDDALHLTEQSMNGIITAKAARSLAAKARRETKKVGSLDWVKFHDVLNRIHQTAGNGTKEMELIFMMAEIAPIELVSELRKLGYRVIPKKRRTSSIETIPSIKIKW